MPVEVDAELPSWVDQLAAAQTRAEAISRLRVAGAAAVPALVAGVSHPDAAVRAWCCRVLDHQPIDAGVQARLVAATTDRNRRVRHAALHTLVCEACKPAASGWRPPDVVGLLVDALRGDPSLRVRRFAAGSLMYGTLERRVRRAFRRVLRDETDPVLRRRAAWAIVEDQLLREGASRERFLAEFSPRADRMAALQVD